MPWVGVPSIMTISPTMLLPPWVSAPTGPNTFSEGAEYGLGLLVCSVRAFSKSLNFTKVCGIYYCEANSSESLRRTQPGESRSRATKC